MRILLNKFCSMFKTKPITLEHKLIALHMIRAMPSKGYFDYD